MEDLKIKKEILIAIKEAVASIKLDEEFDDLEVTNELIEDVNKKIKRLVL